MKTMYRTMYRILLMATAVALLMAGGPAQGFVTETDDRIESAAKQ
jgi:hypothetical protein